jgi:hypothetical protein
MPGMHTPVASAEHFEQHPAMKFLRVLTLLLLFAAPSASPAQAGPRARVESDAVVRAALPVAQEMLLAHGEFAPFGMGLTSGNEVVDIAASPARDRADPGDPVSLLRQALSDAMRNGQVRATVLVYEARLIVPPSKTAVDAIAVALAHRENHAAVIVYPYEFRDGRVVLGEPHVIEHGNLPLSARPPRRR